MNNEMNQTQKIRIMPLGDSITRGKGGSSWRHHLRNLLKDEDILIQYVGSSPHAPNTAKIVGIIDSCRSKGRQVRFVDMYPHFLKDDILEDGIHPNIYGDQKIAKIWSQAIVAFLKQDEL